MARSSKKLKRLPQNRGNQIVPVAQNGRGLNTEPAFDTENILLQRRMRFNPLRTLDPQILSIALDQFDMGILRPGAMLWESMAMRDDTLITIKPQLENSIASQSWGVFKKKGADETEASRHAATLQYFYEHARATDAFDRNERGGKERLIAQMMRADSYKYAVHHFIWKPKPGQTVEVAGAAPAPVITAELEYVPLWYFENTTGTLRFLPFGGFGLIGEELDWENEWMVTTGRGLMFAGSICYVFKRLAFQDWTIFNERYAQNKVVGMTRASKDSAQGQALNAIVAEYNGDMGIVFYDCSATDKPPIQLLGPSGTAAVEIWEKFLERQDRKLASMYRGNDLSMMSRAGRGERPTGASLQGDEGDAMETGCCRMIAGALHDGIDRKVIKLCYGEDVEPLAYFGLPEKEVDDTGDTRESAGFLADHGAPVAVEPLADRLGIQLAAEGEPTLQPTNRAAAAPEPPDGEEEPSSTENAAGLEADVARLVQSVETALTANSNGNHDAKGRFAALPHVAIDDEKWAGSREELRDRARQVILAHQPVQHERFGEVKFSRDGREKTLSHQQMPDEFQAARALPELIKKGKWSGSLPDRKNRQDVLGFHRLESHLQIGDRHYHAEVTLKQTKDGASTPTKFYLHRLSAPSEKESASGLIADPAKPSRGPAGDANIAPKTGKIKSE